MREDRNGNIWQKNQEKSTQAAKKRRHTSGEVETRFMDQQQFDVPMVIWMSTNSSGIQIAPA
jgi:glucan phosphoethanolaminetransferase (alkaline phosphatase superfamily)